MIPPLASHTRKGPERRAYKPQFRQKRKRSRSPAGPRRRRQRTHAIGVHPLPPAVLMVAISLAAQDRAVAKGGKARVSPCEPLCAILLAKASVYPPQSLETNVAAFAPEVLKAVRPMCWKRWYDCVSCAFAAFPRTKKKAVGYGFVKG